MDSLDAAAGAQIAGWLLDEHDLATLRCTNRFWRDVLSDNPALWSQLLARRFGAAAPRGEGSGAVSAAPGSPAAGNPERRFRQLAAAALRRPVASLERLIWLDGNHLQRIDDPSSPYGTTVRVASVWWLELGGRFRGVLPGRYCLAWRLRMEPGSHLNRVHLVARQKQPAAWPAGDGASSCGEARESVQEWQWTLDGAGITACRARGLAAAAALRSAWVAHALSQTGWAQQAHTWHGWFEVAGEAFEVGQLCDLWVELRETEEWKGGIVLDSVRLVRQHAQQGQQQGQQQQLAGEAAESQEAGAGQEVSGSSPWARLRRAARALLPG